MFASVFTGFLPSCVTLRHLSPYVRTSGLKGAAPSIHHPSLPLPLQRTCQRQRTSPSGETFTATRSVSPALGPPRSPLVYPARTKVPSPATAMLLRVSSPLDPSCCGRRCRRHEKALSVNIFRFSCPAVLVVLSLLGLVVLPLLSLLLLRRRRRRPEVDAGRLITYPSGRKTGGASRNFESTDKRKTQPKNKQPK